MKTKQTCFLVLLFFLSYFLQAQSPCASAPASNTAVVSTTPVCAGSNITLSLTNTYTNSGILYQWVYSPLSALGPFTAIPGATMQVFSTNTLTMPAYYTCVITCTWANASTTATSVYLNILSPNTATTVPYYEGFQTISANNQLPNCLWSASNLGGTCLTFQGAQSMAAFSTATVGTHYFYSQSIDLFPGVTYSAALWARITNINLLNWSNLTLLLGTSASPTGLVPIASTNGPVGNIAFSPVSNTFAVSTASNYFLAVRATCTTNMGSTYLYWDDLSVTIPCTATLNPVSVSITPSNFTACIGAVNSTVNVSAAGATTYSWSTGQTGSSISFSPAIGINQLIVTGTNTLTSCTNSTTAYITNKQAPNIIILSSAAKMCAGQNNTLTLFGVPQGAVIAWSTGQSINPIVVAPNINTTYFVTVTSADGCIVNESIPITVMPLPSVQVYSPRTEFCMDETITLTAGGAITYSWSSGAIGKTVTYVAAGTSTFIVTGTDSSGCSNQGSIAIDVFLCLGAKHPLQEDASLFLQPNPAKEHVQISAALPILRVQVRDLCGRLIFETQASQKQIELDLAILSKGMYYLMVETSEQMICQKLLKE